MIKNKKIKRFLAIFSVLLVLAVSCLGSFASALSMDDIEQFMNGYNYADVSKIPLTESDGKNGYISSVNPSEGTYSIVTTGATTYYAPYKKTNLKLSDFCPEMKVGETYILSLDVSYTLQNSIGVDVEKYIPKSIQLVNVKQWNNGEALTITQEMLDAYVMFRGFNLSAYGDPDMYSAYTTVKVWINKGDVVQPFRSYDKDVLNSFNDNAYNQGYKEGFDASKLAYRLITETNATIHQRFRYASDGTLVNGYRGYDLYDGFVYSENGYTFSLDGLAGDFYYKMVDNPVEDTTSPEVSAYLSDIYLDLWYIDGGYNGEIYGGFYPLTDNLVLGFKNRYGTCRLFVEMFNNDTESFSDLRRYEITTIGTTDDGEYLYFDLSEYVNYSIARITIYFDTTVVNNGGYYLDRDLSLVMAYPDDPIYNIGFTSGRSEGVIEGFANGKAEGETIGYDKGKVDGETIGYDKGKADGETIGYDKGKVDGETIGFNKGYEKGQKGDTWYNFFFSIFDAPVSVIRSMLNFNIFGQDMSSFAFSLFTLCLVITVVKLVI